MTPTHHGRFADPATETRFQQTARGLRLPFVRLYGVLFMLVALAYSIVNPLFVDPVRNSQLAMLLGFVLLVGGTYVAVTFRQDYVKHAEIDFIALLALSILVTQANFVLADFLNSSPGNLHVIGIINRLAVTAFAAVTLAGRPRLFAFWLACDFTVWLGKALPAQADTSVFAYAVLSYLSGAVVMCAINIAIDRSSRGAFALADALDVERARNEAMVHNMLPPAAAAKIRDGAVVADAFADASVVFIDMVGFSTLAKRVSPGHLVELLNAFFNHADRCAAQFGVEKVKTVGDAYLAIAGGTTPCGNSADAAIAFARAVLEGVDELRRVAGVDEVGLRCGIHSGPVVGGVIGATRMAYDYWGETVNIASRIEGTAPANGIAISESTWLRARERGVFGPPMVMTLKGVGETSVYHSVPVILPGEGGTVKAA